MIRSYRDLDFYQDSYQLALEVHKRTLLFPPEAKYELGRQMREASKSIPTNIAEGWGRRESAKDFKHFLLIALGSCDEMRVHLDFSRDLGYIAAELHKEYSERYESVGKRIRAFRERWVTY